MSAPGSGTGTAAATRTRGLVAINITAVIFGTAALFGKLPVSPFWIIGVRSLVATLTMLAWGGWRGELKPIARQHWGGVVASALAMSASWVLFYSTVQFGSVAIATLTFSTFPLFALLIDSWHRRRRPRLVELAATGAIVAAVYLVVDVSPASAGQWGVVAGLGSAALYALFWHFGRALRPALSETMVTISQSALIALAVLPFLPFVSRPPTQLAQWGWLLWFGAINTALASQFYLYALRHLSASSCGAFVAMEPVYAISFAALIFHEPISPRLAVSGAVILAASYVLLRVEADPAIGSRPAPDGHEI